MLKNPGTYVSLDLEIRCYSREELSHSITNEGTYCALVVSIWSITATKELALTPKLHNEDRRLPMLEPKILQVNRTYLNLMMKRPSGMIQQDRSGGILHSHSLPLTRPRHILIVGVVSAETSRWLLDPFLDAEHAFVANSMSADWHK